MRLGDRIAHRYRRNSRLGSRRNISEHYDLSNDFFRLWLDSDLHYSSGLYSAGAQSLEEAQRAKLDLIFEMLNLAGGEHILEIGCGWGALARHAARANNVQVTGVTLSRQQLAYARKQADKEGFGASCKFLLQDYRDVRGSFDHIVSVEMVEAVGEDYWPAYFQVLNDRLITGGAAVIQAITIDETRFDAYRRKADFIQRYIFPGGLLPTPAAIAQQAALAGLRIERVERFGLSYARTLREWRKRFEATWPQAVKLGLDERFRRQWRYYLAYCEAAFLEGVIDVGIYQLRKA
ncbi:MAG: class I SAM-dependent methyltransferase [Filomicrobium sp.]